MLLLVLGHFSTWAQPGESWYNLYFPVSKSQVDAEFGNNQQSMDGISTLLRSLADRGVDSVHVALHSYCSPEGRIGFNEELVRDRLANTREWMQSLEGIPVLSFTTDMTVSTREMVKEGEQYPYYRRCDIGISYVIPQPVQPELPVEEVPETPDIPETPATPDIQTPAEVIEPSMQLPVPEWEPSWYLKTNFLAYPLNLTANLAAEIEIGRHFSLSVPVYYSALNWFRSTIKFRVLGSQPEFRYWFQDNALGPFVSAHFTFGWYNIALGGMYRYQDHATTSPVAGGGLTAGWRVPVGHTRWAFEFTVGAGYLPLYYDTFYNVDNGAMAQEGLWKHYWGIDNAAVTLSYRFGPKR